MIATKIMKTTNTHSNHMHIRSQIQEKKKKLNQKENIEKNSSQIKKTLKYEKWIKKWHKSAIAITPVTSKSYKNDKKQIRYFIVIFPFLFVCLNAYVKFSNFFSLCFHFINFVGKKRERDRGPILYYFNYLNVRNRETNDIMVFFLLNELKNRRSKK